MRQGTPCSPSIRMSIDHHLENGLQYRQGQDVRLLCV